MVNKYVFKVHWFLMRPESEFNEFQIRQKPVLSERRLQSWNIEYNFKWIQPGSNHI